MAINSYTMRPLTDLEKSGNGGYTHRAVITAADLTQATNTTTQALTLGPIPKGSKGQVQFDLVVPFKDADTAGTDSTTASAGDGSSATSLLAAQQLNENGTEIAVPVEGSVSSSAYAADDNLIITFTPKSGTNLNAIDVGMLVVLFKLANPIPWVNASIRTQSGALK